MRLAWMLLAAAGIGAGCASVLAIPNDTPSFCGQPANQGHAYCEDFDVGDPSSRWTFAEATNGATYAIAPSDRSPPSLLDMSAPMVPDGGTALAGFTKEFDDSTFVGLHIEADVRFVTQGGAPITANGGFLLIVDKNGGGCIGLGVRSGPPLPQPAIGAYIFAHGGECSALTSGGGGGVPTQPKSPPRPRSTMTNRSTGPGPPCWQPRRRGTPPGRLPIGTPQMTAGRR